MVKSASGRELDELANYMFTPRASSGSAATVLDSAAP